MLDSIYVLMENELIPGNEYVLQSAKNSRIKLSQYNPTATIKATYVDNHPFRGSQQEFFRSLNNGHVHSYLIGERFELLGNNELTGLGEIRLLISWGVYASVSYIHGKPFRTIVEQLKIDPNSIKFTLRPSRYSFSGSDRPELLKILQEEII